MTLLPVIQPQAPPPLFVSTAAEVVVSRGFYEQEHDGADRFRWMGPQGALTFAPSDNTRFLELWTMSEFLDLSQQLTAIAGDAVTECALVSGWGPLSIAVPAGVSAVELQLNKIFPRAYYPNDARTLGVRIRQPRLHGDAERHTAILRQFENSCLNQREVLTRQVELTSTPPSLGIDLHGACNVKPPCVYCEWDFSKAQEGDHVDVPFTRATLKEWGAFFDNSVTLINCSIGEPFMMKNLDELLDVFGRTGKTLQMTTNGQILTERNIQKIVGLPIDLYVSLDAATPGTYATLRNDTFEKLLANLRRLIQAKGGRGKMPYIHLVFMPMRCNIHELEGFVRLAADLGVDRMVLRPLNYSDSIGLTWERAGHRFEYKHELLPFKDLVRASARAEQLCRALGVELADQMDFGGKMRELFVDDFASAEEPAAPTPDAPVLKASSGADVGAAAPSHDTTPAAVATPSSLAADDAVRPAGPDDSAALPSLGGDAAPACQEPWKSLYILRRGVLPCCYGGTPIAPMEDYRTAWNGPLLQDIRRELLHGRFHDYCLKSPACPIVRKSEQAALLPSSQRARLVARRLWSRLNRDTGNWPNERVYLPMQRTWRRVRSRFAPAPPRA